MSAYCSTCGKYKASGPQAGWFQFKTPYEANPQGRMFTLCPSCCRSLTTVLEWITMRRENAEGAGKG